MSKKAAYQSMANTIIKQLEKRNMKGYYCSTSKEATELAMKLMDSGDTVTWGGSMTLSECGLMDALATSGHTLLDRSIAKTPEEKREFFSKAVLADYYLMSTNAITLDGQLINIDGTGNRIACLSYGPKEVIIIAGMNKVVTDVDTGIERVRNFAAPPNTVRLNCKTPCSATGVCDDCLSKETICCQTMITRFSREPERIKVILVGEDLGY